MSNETISLSELRAAVAGEAVAIRSITKLLPAGGPGDKVFPPTYVMERNAKTKYATENRRIDGREVLTVLLDSVPSQANRMEEALLEGWRRKELRFPVVQVDFSGERDLADLEQITALQAPHRIADAILRDSLLGEIPFRMSEPGRAFTEARPNHATAVYRYCPTALIFGVWDSTGPKGGLGAKFQRCVVSEVVGIDVVAGVKTASRIDPLSIQTKAGPVFQAANEAEEWTVDEAAAQKDKAGKPVLFSRKAGGDGKKGSPAGINHGNIPPSIDATSGGVTMDHAIQTTVLSLPALRRLRFTETVDGKPIAPEKRDEIETTARTALAALALAGAAFQRDNGFDLRSRSLLVPTGPLVFEVLGRDGGVLRTFTLSRQQAANLVQETAGIAEAQGMGWDANPITLRPTPKLAQLVRLSRVLGGDEEESQG